MDTPAPPAASAAIPEKFQSIWPWLGPALAVSTWVWLLAPSVAWFDSGELAAAATSLGVPHPTGFPAFVLAGHELSLVPLAAAALRVHLLGAVCAVAAVVLWRRALGVAWPGHARQALDEAAVCLAPLAMGALAMHIRASEVYAPTWLVAAAALYALTQVPRTAPLLALLTGLGAAIHVEAALLAGTAWLWAEVGLRSRWSDRAGRALLAILAAATLLYLPVAARRQPLLSWGAIDSAEALFRHLSAASIREAFSDRIGAAGGFASLWTLVRDQAWLWLGPAALGLTVTWQRQRSRAVITAAALAIDALYSALVNPMGLRDQQAGLLVLLGTCVLAAEGLAWLLAQVRWTWTGPVLAAGVLWQTHAESADFGQGDLEAGARYADLVVDRAGPGQWMVTTSDHAASACLWRQVGEGARPDAPCLPAVFLRDDAMAAHLARVWRRPALAKMVGAPNGPARLGAWVAGEVADQPLRWEVGLAQEDHWLGSQLQLGLPWGTVAVPTAQLGDPIAQAQTVCALATSTGLPCPRALRALLSGQLAVLAGRVASSDRALAERWTRAAVDLQPTPKALGNLAGLVVEREPREALQLAEQALQLQPDYLRAHRQAARAAARLGDQAALVEHLRVLADHPSPDLPDFLAQLRREAAPGLQAAWPK